MLVLLLAYVAGPLGGPPPSVNAVIVGAMVGMVAGVVWSAWVDRNRVVNA